MQAGTGEPGTAGNPGLRLAFHKAQGRLQTSYLPADQMLGSIPLPDFTYRIALNPILGGPAVDLTEVQNGGWELIFPCSPHNSAHPSPQVLYPKPPTGCGARITAGG